MTEPHMRRIPPDLLGLDESEFEQAMDQFFDIRLIQPEKHIQRILWTLVEERTRVGQLRHWLAHAGHNMARPQTEAGVLNTAVAIALADLNHGDPQKAMSILEIVSNEVALSMAGKLDLDVAAWAERLAASEQSKPVIKFIVTRQSDLDGLPQSNDNNHPVIPPREDPKDAKIDALEYRVQFLKDQLDQANIMIGRMHSGEKP